MPQVPPTNLGIREYSAAKRNANNALTTNNLSIRQLPDDATDELRVDSKNTSIPISAFPQHPASTFSSTTEQALNQTGNALEQLKALSIRSANDSTSDKSREILNEEAEELVALIDRIANTTSLDGKNLLDGSIDSISFQVSFSPPTQKVIQGFNAATQVLGKLPGSKQSTGDRVQLQRSVIGNQGIQEGNTRSNIISDFSILVDGQNINESINIADQRYGGLLSNVTNTQSLTDNTHTDFSSGTAKDIANRINTLRNTGEPTLRTIFATATTSFTSTDVDDKDYSGSVNKSTTQNIALGSIEQGDFSINGIDVNSVAFLENDSASTLVHAINAISALTGVTASVNTLTGELSLEADDGRDIVLNTSSADTTNLIFGGGQHRFSESFSDLRVSGRVTISANDNAHFFGSSKSLTGFDDFSLDSTEINQFTNDTIADTNLTSASGAKKAEINIDQAINQVNRFSNKLSALRSEFESSLKAFGSIYQKPRENTANNINSTTAIRLAELSRNLIQQRIDTAVQAQANGTSQQILFYLR
ncbi:hypothetical protein A9Q81_02000 [Gammaproteobacteria bacterium 42_54_T18]|nr:hypothetical protein A9Q81_02000 [Gammaproteobacteria bacterium 42_54_T18]